jgi:hypothetical protein
MHRDSIFPFLSAVTPAV